MLWIKALHIAFMVCWFAGIFYLPRLYVYHAMSNDEVSNERFKIMERKLFWGIMTPSAVLTIVFGLWLLSYGFWGNWMIAKLVLVAILVIYHIWCGVVLVRFRDDRNQHSHTFYRVMNEVPVLGLFAIIILVVVKPF
jgi:putative membrane protein